MDCQRAEILSRLRNEMEHAVTMRLADYQLVQIAIVCSCNQQDEMIDFLFSYPSNSQIKMAARKGKAKLSVCEWEGLFGRAATSRLASLSRTTAPLLAICNRAEFKPHQERIAASLCCTLAETEQQEDGGRPSPKLRRSSLSTRRTTRRRESRASWAASSAPTRVGSKTCGRPWRRKGATSSCCAIASPPSQPLPFEQREEGARRCVRFCAAFSLIGQESRRTAPIPQPR